MKRRRIIAPARPVVRAADRYNAKKVAEEEGCSIRTAQRLMADGKLGLVRGRPRSRWVSRKDYEAYAAKL